MLINKCSITLLLVLFSVVSYGQYQLKWPQQKIKISIPTTPVKIEEDTISEVDYFEFVSDNYDFGIEMISTKDEDYEFHKDLYTYGKSEMEKELKDQSAKYKIGKVDKLNSFYALMVENGIDPKTGTSYEVVVGELIFYSEQTKDLFYFDIEYDNVELKVVEQIIKSIMFYK